jgi:hypothetical protein
MSTKRYRVELPVSCVWHYWVTRSTPNVGSRVNLATVAPMLRGMVAYAMEDGRRVYHLTGVGI